MIEEIKTEDKTRSTAPFIEGYKIINPDDVDTWIENIKNEKLDSPHFNNLK